MSLKQNYLDLCAQSVDVKEFSFREISFLKNKVTSYEQQMDHVMLNFGNIYYKTELEMKVSSLEKENFELRGQLIDKVVIIKQLKTDSKSNPFPTEISTTTNTIITMITSTAIIIIIITKKTTTITASTTIL